MFLFYPFTDFLKKTSRNLNTLTSSQRSQQHFWPLLDLMRFYIWNYILNVDGPVTQILWFILLSPYPDIAEFGLLNQRLHHGLVRYLGCPSANEGADSGHCLVCLGSWPLRKSMGSIRNVASRRHPILSKDPQSPGHSLISLLPSWRRRRSLRPVISGFKNSYFPLASKLLNHVAQT